MNEDFYVEEILEEFMKTGFVFCIEATDKNVSIKYLIDEDENKKGRISDKSLRFVLKTIEKNLKERFIIYKTSSVKCHLNDKISKV